MSQSSLPTKPPYGSPCNGCGLCCLTEQCLVSEALFGEQELCPAIEQAGDAIACGLMVNTANYVDDLPAWGGKVLTETFALMIGSGIGCDASSDDEATEELRAQIRSAAEAKIAQASPEAKVLVGYFRGA